MRNVDGATLLALAEAPATRVEAVAVAQHRLDNGSKSRFPRMIVAKYGSPEPAKVTVSTPAPTREDQLVLVRKMASEDAKAFAAENAPEGQYVKTVRRTYAVLRDRYIEEFDALGVLLPV